MALARALEPASNASASTVTAAEPTAIEPWAETVLFGSVAELKKLLDDGLDPNAATGTGGTTVLMMAAPDVAKMSCAKVAPPAAIICLAVQTTGPRRPTIRDPARSR